MTGSRSTLLLLALALLVAVAHGKPGGFWVALLLSHCSPAVPAAT